MTAIGNISQALFMALLVAVGTSAAGYGMVTALKLEEPVAAETESTQVVYYHELKNLGGGNYLCEVWSYSNMDTTIIKLTASEKAKLQRAYIK